jgi:hypothetical protein
MAGRQQPVWHVKVRRFDQADFEIAEIRMNGRRAPKNGEIINVGIINFGVNCRREDILVEVVSFTESTNFNQLIALEGQPRRFGGRQWYFVCPLTKRPVSVVWKPDGADQFCSRQAWGSQVAYLSQFGSLVDRAHLGKARIAALFDTSNPQDSELPRKPKWMRSSTYNRHVRKYNNYEAVLQARCAALAPRSWREG